MFRLQMRLITTVEGNKLALIFVITLLAEAISQSECCEFTIFVSMLW